MMHVGVKTQAITLGESALPAAVFNSWFERKAA
ncbi:hypothetical protein J2Z75_003302 [Rhizobium herbae]|uniref:Uncharacterized protein n=1 Tax=Rhizobium herbae TaxID=508661 RepID=A0ABS4EPC5_9HYPH|nr:hypothetical protein [Rhizobium herbae]